MYVICCGVWSWSSQTQLCRIMKKYKIALFLLVLYLVYLAIYYNPTNVNYFNIHITSFTSNRTISQTSKTLAKTTSEPSKNVSIPTNTVWKSPDNYPAFFIPRSTIVNPLNFTIITNSSIDCDPQKPPFLTVLVLTMHSHTEFREAIRKTWGSIVPKLIFLVGLQSASLNEAVKRESEKTKDIIMYDFQDSYFNLTYKVLLGFKWVKEHCKGTKYVMKIDEDTFVDIKQVMENLQSPDWNTKISGPYFGQTESCQRQGKYKVLVSSYPFHLYPPHVKGNIYFMPTAIALKLLNVSYYMPYCNMEDAYITGILARATGENLQYQSIKGSLYHTGSAFQGCRFMLTHKLASQGFSPSDIHDLWKKIRDRSKCFPGSKVTVKVPPMTPPSLINLPGN